MADTADVVVVGGGVVGASIAFHLSRLDAGKVLLIERAELADGATSRSGALVRMHYGNEPEARVAAAALPWFEEWPDRVGGNCGFVRTGFLQLVTAADVSRLRSNIAMLQKVGVDTQLVDSDQLAQLQPGLQINEGEYGAYEPRGGFADPVATTRTLAEAAGRGGAQLLEHTEVRRLLVDGDKIIGVETEAGPVHAGVVVLANGCWSLPLLRTIGVELPIISARAQVALVSRPVDLRGEAGHVTMIDRRSGIYARPNGAAETLVGVSRAADAIQSPENVQVTDGFPALALQRLAQSLPAFGQQQILRSRAGVLDVTPDHCALIGPVQAHSGLQLAVGMSGSGFKTAPVWGACIAELILHGRASTAPMDAFSPDRFDRQQPIASNDYILGTAPDGSGRALVH